MTGVQDPAVCSPLFRWRWLIGTMAALALAGYVGWRYTVVSDASPLPPGDQAVLADGSILVLRAVLFDPKATLVVKGPTTTPLDYLWYRRELLEKTILRPALNREVRIALSRHDPKSGASLDLTCFRYLEVTDSAGNRVRNFPTTFEVHDDRGQSSGSLALEAMPPVPVDQGYRILACDTDRFATNGPATLRVFNSQDQLVATFPLTIPVDQAEPLPKAIPYSMTWRGGREEVRLRGLELSGSRKHKVGDLLHDDDAVNADWLVMVDGMPSPPDHWRRTGFYVDDSFGNVKGGLFLPAHQPWWKMHLTLYRSHSAPLAESERTAVGQIELPPPGGNTLLQPGNSTIFERVCAIGAGSSVLEISKSWTGHAATRQHSNFEHWYCGGPGGDTPSLHARLTGRTFGGLDKYQEDRILGIEPEHRSFGLDMEIRFVQSSASPVTQLEINTNMPLLVLTTPLRADLDALLLAVEDDQGHPIPVLPLDHPYRRMPLYACRVFPDSKSLTVSVVKDPPRNVEFVIPPPNANLEVPEVGWYAHDLELVDGSWKVIDSKIQNGWKDE